MVEHEFRAIQQGPQHVAERLAVAGLLDVGDKLRTALRRAAAATASKGTSTSTRCSVVKNGASSATSRSLCFRSVAWRMLAPFISVKACGMPPSYSVAPWVGARNRVRNACRAGSSAAEGNRFAAAALLSLPAVASPRSGSRRVARRSSS